MVIRRVRTLSGELKEDFTLLHFTNQTFSSINVAYENVFYNKIKSRGRLDDSYAGEKRAGF